MKNKLLAFDLKLNNMDIKLSGMFDFLVDKKINMKFDLKLPSIGGSVDLSLPSFGGLPSLKLPSLSLGLSLGGGLKLPSLPSVSLPSISLPSFSLPSISLPNINLPSLPSLGLKLPSLSLGLKLPSLPSFGLGGITKDM